MAIATTFIKQNIGAIGAGVGGLAVGAGLGYIAARKRSKRKSSKRSKRRNKSIRKRNRVYREKKGIRYRPHTAGKRRDTSKRRIRYTSRGQPYIIGAHGKARFISKKSARLSHKRIGGRY